MATQKKTSSSTRKKKSSSKSASAQALKKKKAEAARKRRVYGAFIVLVVALFGFLGYFNTDAILLNWFRTLCCGLIGVGYWLMPPALVIIAIFLLSRKTPVLGRVICTAFVPAVIGGLYQVICPKPELNDSLYESMKLLWTDGLHMDGGGAFSGMIAVVMSNLISRVATFIILLLVLILLILKICNSSLVDIVSRVQDNLDERAERREEEQELLDSLPPEEEEEQDAQPTRVVHKKKASSARSQTQVTDEATRRVSSPADIDVPMQEDEGDRENKQEPATEPEPEKKTEEETEAPVPEPAPEVEEEEKLSDRADSEKTSPEEKEEEPDFDQEPPDDMIPDAPEVELGSETEPEKAGTQVDLNLSEFPEMPDFGIGEENDGNEEHVQPADEPEISDEEIRKLSDEILSEPEEVPEEEEPVPEGMVKITREPAVVKKEDTSSASAQKVTRKEAAAAAATVTVAAAAAMDKPVEQYRYPPLDLLDEPKAASNAGVKEEMASTQAILVDTIESFGITVHLKDVTRGPAVARFEMELDRGVKLSKLTNLSDDIALSLGVSGVRIAPVPDKPSMVGIEVPNRKVNPVPIRSVIDSDAFRKSKSKISFALGKDISGTCIVSDIGKLPHLLISGTTGSGKSVCINSMLVSLLYKSSPEDVRMIMVDPKQVELGVYNGIPHLLIPVVTDAKKAAGALQWAVTEMTRRYSEIAEVGARRLSEYNKIAEKDPERKKMPYIVIVIDELADLMMVAGKEVEDSICRIAQLGRAAGMHLVVATQRPSSDVITGLMKANIPSRISFAVASAVESRIILDSSGAEKLVGKGDMLYHPIGSNKALRVQGCLITDEEVARVVDFVKQNCGEAEYDDNVSRQVNIAAAETGAKNGKGKKGESSLESPLGDYDEMLPSAVDIVLELGQASVSMLQRRLKLGYARAARLVDQMEELGIVGPFEGSKPRQLKITKEEWAEKRTELFGAPSEQMTMDMEMNEMNEEARQADLDDPLNGDDNS